MRKIHCDETASNAYARLENILAHKLRECLQLARIVDQAGRQLARDMTIVKGDVLLYEVCKHGNAQARQRRVSGDGKQDADSDLQSPREKVEAANRDEIRQQIVDKRLLDGLMCMVRINSRVKELALKVGRKEGGGCEQYGCETAECERKLWDEPP